DSLEEFRDPSSWQKMGDSERELLGQLFVLQGEELLKKEDCAAIDLFEKAAQVAPESAKVSYLIAKGLCALGKSDGEASDFHMALNKFQVAASKGLNEPEFWKDYGDTYKGLANLIGRGDLYIEAVQCYQKAIKISHDYFQGWLSLGTCYFHLFEI